MSGKDRKPSGFTFYNFMIEQLGLGGGELLVFTVIYSFTKGDGGLFYGTQEYLAKVTGLSASTVWRSLNSLIGKGYIEKCVVREREGYRSAVDETGVRKETGKPTEQPCEEEEYCLPPPYLMTDYGQDLSHYIDPDEDGKPKYDFYPVSKKGLLTMTPAQYKSLLELVAPEILKGYIDRLEWYIENEGYKVYNAYKTIRGWIVKDGSISV